MINRRLPLYIDIVFCIILLPVMMMMLPVEKWIMHNPMFFVTLILWLYCVYFLHRFVSVPMLFRKNRTWVALLIFVGTIAVTYIIARLQFDPHHFHKFEKMRNDFRFFPKMRLREQGMWFMFFVVTCFSFAVGLLTQLARQIVVSKELQGERDKAELALYKAQINPHFLFNTLNSLYSLIIQGSEKSETAFMQFIDMLKYMYSNGDKEKIPLVHEIEYIRQYIELQKLRLNEHTKIDFECRNIDAASGEIAPMLLITFVENAFKYGISSHEDCYIDIRAEVTDGVLNFSVENLIMRRPDNRKGLGLKNCRKRLELLYKDKYGLNIIEHGNKFRIDFKLNLR